MKSAITLNNIYQRFADAKGKKTEILKDINLTIHEGEFFVILGESGAGKSTLIRIMSGLDKPSSGEVVYDKAIDMKEDIGFVFQQFAILPWLTVSENIELGLIGRRVPEARRAEILARELASFKLEKFAHLHPHELSGGQKQRVGLARAFATESKIIFLDEPFSELDFFTSEELRKDLLTIWQQRKQTVIMISHNITEAVELADRIAVMSARPGQIKSIIDNKLPRPRVARTSEVYSIEDELYKLLK